MFDLIYFQFVQPHIFHHYMLLIIYLFFLPFLLLTAAMYFRSSPRLYYWLIQQKYLGSYIRNFREHKAIPLHAKIVSVSLIWITLSYCAIWILPYIWARILFLIIAISTTWHIVSYKTLKQ